ncbi:MAG: LacI family DNA-binding transcriptional regulator [Mycoplasmatales bacterium]
MSTLKDISLKSGFSVSAVSRVLSGDKTFSINQDNKNKIIATAKELNYVNKAKSTNDFKIAIINWYSQDQELVDPYYYYIRKGVEKQCQEDKINYKLIFKEDDLTNLNNFDSIIAIGKFGNMTLKQLSLYNKHIVFVDSNIDNNLYNSIQVDFSVLMKEIFDYLI